MIAVKNELDDLRDYISDLEMKIVYLEDQATNIVTMYEELSLEKQLLEIRKRESDYLAQHDPLTGLLNRSTINSLVSALFQENDILGKSAKIYFVDLDNFKEVNDAYGHEAGDEVLLNFSTILKKVFSDYHAVGRMGGDEFIIVQPWRVNFPDDISYIIEDLSKSLRKLNAELGFTTEIGASIGITNLRNRDVGVKELLNRADKLMYRAKKIEKKNGISFISD